MEPRNRFRCTDSASLCSQAGRYDKWGCRTGPPCWESIPGLLKRSTSTGSAYPSTTHCTCKTAVYSPYSPSPCTILCSFVSVCYIHLYGAIACDENCNELPLKHGSFFLSSYLLYTTWIPCGVDTMLMVSTRSPVKKEWSIF
jgi:hypothetical protein